MAVLPQTFYLPLERAKLMLNAAEAEAKKNNWNVAIAIVDGGSNLIAFQKMDGTQQGSVDVAIGKARTAINFKRSSKDMEDLVCKNKEVGRLGFLALEGIVPIQGGIPIVYEGTFIGAIGVSGVQSIYDEQVAKAGLNALSQDIVRNKQNLKPTKEEEIVEQPLRDSMVYQILFGLLFFWSAHLINVEVNTKDQTNINWNSHLSIYLLNSFVAGVFVYSCLTLKDDLCKGKPYSWFRSNHKFTANIVEAFVFLSCIPILTLMSLYVKGVNLEFSWVSWKIYTMLVCLYVVPVYHLYLNLHKNWNLGGKWGRFLFETVIFFPLMNVAYYVFRYFCLNLYQNPENADGALQIGLWNDSNSVCMSLWEGIEASWGMINQKGDFSIKILGYTFPIMWIFGLIYNLYMLFYS